MLSYHQVQLYAAMQAYQVYLHTTCYIRYVCFRLCLIREDAPAERCRDRKDGTDCRWYILTQLEGSLSNLVLFAKIAGVQGVRNVWPWPSVEAWAILGAFGGLQAMLQLGLPGKEHHGPVSPKGNVPVYKVAMRKICSASGYRETVNIELARDLGHLPQRTLSATSAWLPVITFCSRLVKQWYIAGNKDVQREKYKRTIAAKQYQLGCAGKWSAGILHNTHPFFGWMAVQAVQSGPGV